MRRLSLLHYRPSAPLVMSVLSLFVSLGGVGYAAVELPAGSVGTAQLRNGSVSYRKIQPRAVGTVRANLNQLQARISDTCAPTTAIGAVSSNGTPSCVSTLPPQTGVTNTQAVTSTLTKINDINNPTAGHYLELANPTATVTGNGTSQRVTVTCTLTVGPNQQTRSATVDTGTATTASTVSIPLAQSGSSGEPFVSCSSNASATPPANVSVTSSLYEIQTAD